LRLLFKEEHSKHNIDVFLSFIWSSIETKKV